MSYVTIKDIKKRIDLAIADEKYHIAITIQDDDELICDCYCNGIETEEIINLLKKESCEK